MVFCSISPKINKGEQRTVSKLLKSGLHKLLMLHFINLVLTSAAVDELEPVASSVSSSIDIANYTLTVGHLPGIARLLDLEVLVFLHNLTLVLTCNNNISDGKKNGMCAPTVPNKLK